MERIKRRSFKNALERVGINNHNSNDRDPNHNEFEEDLEIS